MKKLLVKIVILIVIVCSLASCAKDELFYSCDTEVDMWVKSNIAEINNMSRADWLAISDHNLQRAVYAAFTSSQKEALWIGKIEEVLTLDWTEKERQHLQSVLDMISIYSSIFFTNEPNSEEIDKRVIIEYRWEEYARTELGWSDELLYNLIYTPLAMDANKQIDSNIIDTPRLKSRIESEPYYDCNCVIDKDCNKIGGTCRTRNCKKIKVCGTLFNHVDCTGMCGED